MTPTETDIARKLVASPHWYYERGQVYARPSGRMRVVVTDVVVGMVWWATGDGESRCLPENFPHAQYANALPDLNAYPTNGSMVGMAKRAWAADGVSVDGRDDRWSVTVRFPLPDGTGRSETHTEIAESLGEALALAILAAPVKP